MILMLTMWSAKNKKFLIVDQYRSLWRSSMAIWRIAPAIEAKEGVQSKMKPRHQHDYLPKPFRMYKNSAGMTGTGKTEEEEFRVKSTIFVLFQFLTNVRSNVSTIQTFTLALMQNSRLSLKTLYSYQKRSTSLGRYCCRWKPVIFFLRNWLEACASRSIEC